MRHILLCLVLCTVLVTVNAQRNIDYTKVKMYKDFTIRRYYAGSMPGVRAITASGSDGRITYYGSTGGTVYALVDQGVGKEPIRYEAVKGFNNKPGGVGWYQGALFVADKNQVFRFDNIDSKLTAGLTVGMASKASQYYSNWTHPAATDHHGLKGAIAIKDGLIYIPIGAPCNHPNDGNGRTNCYTAYSSIITMSTTSLVIIGQVAKGHRNSVGMDFSPKTGELWFTDNGRDSWGVNGDPTAEFRRPSDELNRMSRTGQDFGFPNCYGTGLTFESGGNDAQYNTKSCLAADSPYTNSEWDVGAHTASLGMQFLSPTSTWPQEFQGSVLIAQHGCWNCEGGNRGYQVIAVKLDAAGTKATGQVTIADFRTYVKDQPNGRPVDVQNMPDGSILVSDDNVEAVYQIRYNGPPFVAPTTGSPPTTRAPVTQAPVVTLAPTKPVTQAPVITQAPTTTTKPVTTQTPITTQTPTNTPPVDPVDPVEPTARTPILVAPGDDTSSSTGGDAGSVSNPTTTDGIVVDVDVTPIPTTTRLPTARPTDLGRGSSTGINAATSSSTFPSVMSFGIIVLMILVASL